MIYTFRVVAHIGDTSEEFFKLAEADTREEARQQIVARCDAIDAQFPIAWSEVSE